ncbi:MAG: methyltransferase domain-containing protein [Xanthomonadales bacterium]|nr:methyltransferase domain-containing protein [Xanthomonadales bacterium]
MTADYAESEHFMGDLTPALDLGDIEGQGIPWQSNRPATARIPILIESPMAFDVDVSVELRSADEETVHYVRHTGADQLMIRWLPRGRYDLEWYLPRLRLGAGSYRLVVTLYHRSDMGVQAAAQEVLEVPVEGEQLDGEEGQTSWILETVEGPPVSELSWRKGPEDWFYRHFDHAADTIIHYMLGDSPLLRGRVLDVGCGDGITDLGIFLRCQPELLVGIDPFRGYERLPDLMKDNHVPLEELPEGLVFRPCDGNHIPYPDDYFDVVVSWGSLEHIAGGYLQTLREIKRVLRNGGLFFVHPGLYYSNFGHHLGEFTSEPFVHLTRPEPELRKLVLESDPDYIDRGGGYQADPAEYWQWYKELNPITVANFEQELRALEFEFWRVALRTEDLIEYSSPSLQRYGMQDLATLELYLSCHNRKSPRPEDFEISEAP